MKKLKNKFYILVFSSMCLISCEGDKGDTGGIGPQGATGTNGVAGQSGSKGSIGDTGSKGEKGVTGDTGPNSTITASSSPWQLLEVDLNPFLGTSLIYADLLGTFNISNLLGSNTNFSSIDYGTPKPVYNSTSKLITGNLYSFYSILVDGKEYVYSNKFNSFGFSISSNLSGSNQTIKSESSFEIINNSELIKNTATKIEIVDFVKKYNCKVRFVYVPLPTSGQRQIAVDFNDYQAVKKAFNLKE